MDIIEREEIISETLKILYEYGIGSYDDWYSQDGEEACVLYEVMKAGIQERFGLDDDDMDNLLNEILD